ncbi:MAG: hypothetical protein DSZ21_02350 [Tenericutes bacterium]|nr:MAG: hypothetical protein DSZ21_02350 [Mycoplasmatota bacterium]
MPLAGYFFKINLSIVFILFTTFVAGYGYSFILQLIRLVIGPSMSSLGYSDPGMFGMAISFFAIFIFTSLAYLAYKTKLIKSKGPIILSLIIITLITSLIMTLANGLFLVDT